MRPSSTLQPPPQFERVVEGRPLHAASLLSLVLLAIILVAGICVLGAVRPWIELPILGGVTLLLIIQALRLVPLAPIGSLRQIDAIDLSVLLFTVYVVVRWLTSPSEFISRFEALSVIGYAVVFLFCRYGIARRTYGVALIILLAAVGAGEVIFGYLLHVHSNIGDPQSLWFPFGPTEQMQLYWSPRWVGTYGCPNHYACLLVMAFGAALALGCFSRFSWPVRIIFFYLGALLLVGILYSQSRGSWLSLIGAMAALIYFAFRYAKLRWWIPTGGSVILAALLTAVFVSSGVVQHRVGEMTKMVERGTVSRYVRVELTRDSLRIAHDHPVFGTGPATYNFIDPRYQDAYLQIRAVFAHNDYLNVLDDYGLIGFALAMFFVAAVTLSLGSQIRPNSRWTERVVVATALMAWSALLIHSLLDFNMHIPANAMLLFALTGMALARKPGEDAPHHWSTISLVRLGPWLGWGLLVFALCYGFGIGRTALSDIPYENAAADAEIMPTIQSIHEVEQALAFDSGNAQALILLGDLHRVRAGRADDDEQRAIEAQQALTAYQKALKANPLDDSINARLGMTYDLLNRYSEAYLCYQAAVTAQPYDGQFWMALGNHFLDRGLLDKAEMAYSKAEKCPHGGHGAAEKADKIRGILNLNSFLPAESAPTNSAPVTRPTPKPKALEESPSLPVTSPVESEAPPTVPAPPPEPSEPATQP